MRRKIDKRRIKRAARDAHRIIHADKRLRNPKTGRLREQWLSGAMKRPTPIRELHHGPPLCRRWKGNCVEQNDE
jgi:hypothetical protein